MKTFSLIIWIVVLAVIGAGQSKADVEKQTAAIERVNRAASVLRLVAGLPDGKGIPKEISEKMNLVGVIPDAENKKVLVSTTVRGHGVSSLRQDGRWSLPAYYYFGVSNGYDLSAFGREHFDLIMACVNARLPKQQKPKNKSDEPKVYVYAFIQGELRLLTDKKGLMATFGWTNLAYDGSLNKAVYNAKGDDILLGSTDPNKTPPSEVISFRDALNQAFPEKR